MSSGWTKRHRTETKFKLEINWLQWQQTSKCFPSCLCHLNFSFSHVCLFDLLSSVCLGLRQGFLQTEKTGCTGFVRYRFVETRRRCYLIHSFLAYCFSLTLTLITRSFQLFSSFFSAHLSCASASLEAQAATCWQCPQCSSQGVDSPCPRWELAQAHCDCLAAFRLGAWLRTFIKSWMAGALPHRCSPVDFWKSQIFYSPGIYQRKATIRPIQKFLPLENVFLLIE